MPSPPFLSLLKDHYDFVLAIGPVEKDPFSQTFLHESDHIFFIAWDQATDLAGPVRSRARRKTSKGRRTDSNRPPPASDVWRDCEPAHFRVPGANFSINLFGKAARPISRISKPNRRIVALERIARTLGKLRVGMAFGSGSAYGYSLVGILKVFEREDIPIDMAAGTSMGALFGSFYCAERSPEIQEISKTITKHWLRQNIIGDLTFPHGGFLAGQTLSAFLRSILGNDRVQSDGLPFAAVATDIRTGT